MGTPDELSKTLRVRTRELRARALARRPRTMYEVLHAAELLGIDPFETPELIFLAEEAVCCGEELPLGWDAIPPPKDAYGGAFANDAAGETCYYHNPILQISQWQHPKLTYLVALARAYSAPDASESEEIERD